MRWDAARAASRRQLPKPRKMHGPYSTLGEPHWRYHSGFPGREDKVCGGCGHHVCSCEPIDRSVIVYGSDGVAHRVTEDELNRKIGTPQPFDDHARHVTDHMLAAERLGICGLCHSAEHKLLACQAYIRALEACR